MSISPPKSRRLHVLLVSALLVLASACKSEAILGRDATRPEFYQMALVDFGSLPAIVDTLPFGGYIAISGGTLIPYAVGKPGDQRLVNDRTGNGGTGGNTRDTTVARGQMMDLRIVTMLSSQKTVLSVTRDSQVVDVELRDTIFIVARPHPDPARVRVDTGYYVNSQLVIKTKLDLQKYGSFHTPEKFLSYTITK